MKQRISIVKGLAILSLVIFGVVSIIASTGAPTVQVPIVNPTLINQKEARQDFIYRYSSFFPNPASARVFGTRTDNVGRAAFITHSINSGKVKLDGVKSYHDGQWTVFLFSEGSQSPHYFVIFFTFNKGSKIFRRCYEGGLCEVWVNGGSVSFGWMKKDDLIEKGNTVEVTVSAGSGFQTELLFGYDKSSEREGNELISLFLSAFPVLSYQ